MSGFVFFDSNVLVYSDDGSSKAKQRRAIDLIARHLADGTAVFSLQVLQEYFAVSTRKFKVPAETAQQKVQIFARAKVVYFTPSDVIAAIELHRLRGLSFWDSLIVYAARLAGAGILYSEDLQTGGMVESVRVVNPFIAGEER